MFGRSSKYRSPIYSNEENILHPSLESQNSRMNLRNNSSDISDENSTSIALNQFHRTEPYSTLDNIHNSGHNNEFFSSGPYREDQNSYDSLKHGTNPFDSDNSQYPTGNPYFPSAANPFEAAPETEKEKIRRNEKERIRQLRSKPRFHYTRLPYFVIIATLAQVGVFIAELAKMSELTGSAFQTKPYFNPMLGPSTYLLINMGARYAPCMHRIMDITDDTSINFPCPNSTSISTDICTLNELCGLGGIPSHGGQWYPHQWYRIVTPIFLHAGFIHILFNLLLQVTMGATIERNIGSLKFAIIYMLSGISGFLLGANFSPAGIASTGASGALFGILATNIVMFIFSGRKNNNIYGSKNYAAFISLMLAEIIVSLVLGLLPGLDNFSHLGGFAIGILLAILLLKDPFFVYQDGIITYESNLSTFDEFRNNWNPMLYIEDKIPSRYYIWIFVRFFCLALVVLYFALLSKNFFISGESTPDNHCSWCKYISCIPVHGWCDIGELTVQNTTSNRIKRSLAFQYFSSF